MSIRNRIEDRVHSEGIWRRKRRFFERLSDRRIMAVLTIVPALALFSFVSLLPMIWAVWSSLHEISAFDPEWTFTGLDNYVWVLSDIRFWESLGRGFIFAVGSVILQVAFGTWLALMINREFKYATFVRALAMLPYLIPTAVLGFVALWMGNSQFGIINQLLVQVGLIDSYIAFYGSQSWAMISVIFTNSWKFSIFVTIMVLARLQGIPEGLYEAATVSGATSYQKFRDITLPNLKGVLFIVILLRGIWTFNRFDIIYVLTRGGPLSSTTTGSIYAYNLGFERFTLGRATAVSTLLFFLLAAFAVFYFYKFEPSQEVRVE